MRPWLRRAEPPTNSPLPPLAFHLRYQTFQPEANRPPAARQGRYSSNSSTRKSLFGMAGRTHRQGSRRGVPRQSCRRRYRRPAGRLALLVAGARRRGNARKPAHFAGRSRRAAVARRAPHTPQPQRALRPLTRPRPHYRPTRRPPFRRFAASPHGTGGAAGRPPPCKRSARYGLPRKRAVQSLPAPKAKAGSL